MKNLYCYQMILFLLIFNLLSCTGAGKNFFYRGEILNTDSIAMPNLKPAKGSTEISQKIWLHPEIVAELVERGKSQLDFQIKIDWEMIKKDGIARMNIMHWEISYYGIDGDLENSNFLSFSCIVNEDGTIDNIEASPGAIRDVFDQKAFENSKSDMIAIVRLIVPQFQIRKFKRDDTVLLTIEDYSNFIKGLENFPLKFVYKGISTYEGRDVIVVECNDKVVRDHLKGTQKGYFLFDRHKPFIVASESEVKVNYDGAKIFTATTRISTVFYEE